MARIYRRPNLPGGTYYLDRFQDGRRVRCSLETTVLKEAKRRRDSILSGEIDRLTGHVDAAEFESNRFLEDLELFISKLGREKADGSTDKIQEINTNLASLNWRSWGMRWMYL